jgi:hypothetical protein
MRLTFMVIAAALTLALAAVVATPPPDPKPDIIKPCLCPYKNATLCAIYCGLY